MAAPGVTPAPEQLSLGFEAPGAAVVPGASPALPSLAEAPAPTAGRAPVEAALTPPRDDKRRIELLGHALAYSLRRMRRRTIGFTVGPQGLAVSAPRWVGLADIEAALQAKAAWIVRKLGEQDERQRRSEAARIRWEEGALLPFMGQRLSLHLDPSGARAPGGALLEPGSPPRLVVALPLQADPDRIRDVVHGWWQRQAKRVFEERCALYAERLGVRMKRLSLSSALTRWGSASADGSVRLNWRLIHYPLSTIDYVVVHELAHLREMNHSPAFWEVVRSVLPGYEAAQGPLKEGVVVD